MCGASDQQKDLAKQQASFYQTLQNSYAQQFSGQQAILANLTKSFTPILQRGPNQQGFSQGERTALNTQATEGVAQDYAHAAQAVNSQLAAQGGGNTYLPSGANAQIQGQLASSAAAQQAAERNQIAQADYATGRANYFQAANVLGGAASQYNPNAGAGMAIEGGNAAANTANQIAQANQSWMGVLGGVIGGIPQAAGQYFGRPVATSGGGGGGG